MSMSTLITGGLGFGARMATYIKGGLSSRRQLPEPPPSGYTQLTMIAQAATSPFKDYIAAGDILQYKTTTEEGYSLTVGTDGEVVISAGGDNSRQRVKWNFWDASADELYFSGDSTVAANDKAPEITVPSLATFYAQPNVVFAPVSIPVLAGVSDPENDAYTVTATLPAGGVLATDGSFTGPFTTAGIYPVVVRVKDEYQAFTETTLTFVIGNLAVPDVRGKDSAEARVILEAAYFSNITLPGTGLILTQVPPAGTVVDPTLAVVLSLQIEEEEEPPPPPFVPPAAELKNRRPVSLRSFLLG